MKVGWLAVFDVFSAHCVFSRFSRSKPPTIQPTNLQHQTRCSARDVKVGRAANLRKNSQPSAPPHPLKPPAGPPQPGSNPHQAPMSHSITATVCRCCSRASWYSPSCGLPGSWPTPTPTPAWPVGLAAACPRCKASLALQITGFAALSPAASALERALGLPPALPRQRGGKGK